MNLFNDFFGGAPSTNPQPIQNNQNQNNAMPTFDFFGGSTITNTKLTIADKEETFKNKEKMDLKRKKR